MCVVNEEVSGPSFLPFHQLPTFCLRHLWFWDLFPQGLWAMGLYLGLSLHGQSRCDSACLGAGAWVNTFLWERRKVTLLLLLALEFIVCMRNCRRQMCLNIWGGGVTEWNNPTRETWRHLCWIGAYSCFVLFLKMYGKSYLKALFFPFNLLK